MLTSSNSAANRCHRLAYCVLLFVFVSLGVTSFAAEPASVSGATEEPITPVPPAPAQDPRRLALGERLFNDPRLSHDDTRSCQSCHDIRTNGASANAHDPTPRGEPLALNTLTIFNAALSFRLNWEGNVRSLESSTQAILHHPGLMASSVDEIVKKLRADPEVTKEFGDAYGRGPDHNNLIDALATFERSLVTPGARFDRWLLGDPSAITPEELAGYKLFKLLGCAACHQGVNVGGNLLERHGVFRPLGASEPELVRVPSLRNVATTAPYFHDGSVATLPEAVKAMGYAQLDRALTSDQITAIVAFLNTLTGTYNGAPVTPRRTPNAAVRP
jgi:cytochrome c peroxidase